MQQFFEEFGEYIVNGIIAFFTGITTYFVTKKRADAETKQIQGDALRTMQDVYDKFVEDTKSKIIELTDEITELTLQVKELTQHVKILETELEDCKKITAR